MRVISGKAGGLRLESVKGQAVRPTADRIKESLFNIIRPVVCDAYVLDLFAGTGALGIEALSRGARFATFVDKSKECVSVIESNLRHTKLSGQAEVYLSSFEDGLRRLAKMERRYDLIFLDPPYGKGFEYKAVEILTYFKLINADGIIVIENEQKDVLPETLYYLKKVDVRSYGRTALNFFKKVEE